MRPGRLTALAGTCLLASLTMATADITIPQAMRVTLGVLIVFLLPGFAVVCAVFPARQLSRGDDMHGCNPRGHADRALPGLFRSRAGRLHLDGVDIRLDSGPSRTPRDDGAQACVKGSDVESVSGCRPWIGRCNQEGSNVDPVRPTHPMDSRLLPPGHVGQPRP